MNMKMIMKSAVMTLAVLGAVAVSMPAAHAAPVVYNSNNGFCCFSVTLTQTDADNVFVNVALTGGATLFASTGNGTNQPGFAFNLAGAAITVANIVSPTNLSTFHVGPDVTSGPDFGTFAYFFDNLGNGTNANNAGPLTFTVHRTGILQSDFIANAAGFRFEADILAAQGGTGESAVSGTQSTVPEPISLSLVGGGLLALGFFRKRFVA